MTKYVDVEELQKIFSKANDDTTPIAVSTDTGNTVTGDASKYGTTEAKDYELTFWLPVTEGQDTSGLELVNGGQAYVQKVTAKQKFITARIGRKVRSYASTIAMAFVNFKDDGDSEIYTVDDLLTIYSIFNDEVIDACEKLVVQVLGVSENMIEYITDVSLMDACAKIMKNNPSFFQVDNLSN